MRDGSELQLVGLHSAASATPVRLSLHDSKVVSRSMAWAEVAGRNLRYQQEASRDRERGTGDARFGTCRFSPPRRSQDDTARKPATGHIKIVQRARCRCTAEEDKEDDGEENGGGERAGRSRPVRLCKDCPVAPSFNGRTFQ